VSTVILAAGASRRLGFNKLCVRVNGETVIRRTVRLFMEAGVRDIVLVTGFERERIEKEVAGLPVTFAYNPNPEEGMSASIKAALPVIAESELALFHLGDKPFLDPGIVRILLARHARGDCTIVVSSHEGIKGHPVLVDMKKHRAAIDAVSGEWGLREIVKESGDEVAFVEAGEGAVLDLDTKDDIIALERRGYTIEKG
jgi:molybdenum cofactor cytidylyltransferase